MAPANVQHSGTHCPLDFNSLYNLHIKTEIHLKKHIKIHYSSVHKNRHIIEKAKSTRLLLKFIDKINDHIFMNYKLECNF